MKFLDATRYSEWWTYKLCPLLAVGYATLLINNQSIFQNGLYLLYLLFSMIAGAVYVCLINDFTDIKEDLACGKPNRLAGISVNMRWLFQAVSLIIMCLFALYFFRHDQLSFFLYLLAFLSFTLYSMKPFRLKKRGFWGILADASGSHLFPSLLFVSAMSRFSGQSVDWLWFLSVGVWALCFGMRGILWHQFQDRKNDRKVGLKTFAVSIHPKNFKMKGKIIFGMEIAAFFTMLFIINAWLCFVFLFLYFLVVLVRYKIIGQEIILIQTPPSNYFQILMLDYYQAFFPLSLLIAATVLQTNAVWILIIHIVLFPQKVRIVFKDMYLAFRRLVMQKTG